MWSLAILLVCVAVIVVYAIYKLSRENTEASASLDAPQKASTPLVIGEAHHHSAFELIGNLLQHEDLFQTHQAREETHADQMIPTSIIIAGVERFKANYHGPNSPQIIAMLDSGLAELKSRFGDQISAHDLREFVKSQRQKMFPGGS